MTSTATFNGIQYKRVELDGSCSSRMENIGDTSSQFSYAQNAYDWEYRPQQMDSLSINGNLYKKLNWMENYVPRGQKLAAHTFIQILSMTGTVDYKHGHAKDGERVEKSPVFSFLRDDKDLSRDDGMAKSMKMVLEENILYDEEMDSQAKLFKGLWLEAEATLCSISYKARFDRLKIEMEQSKPKSSKENKDVAATMQKVHISPAPSTSSKLTLKSQDSMTLKPTTQGRISSVSITVQDSD